MKDSGSVTLYPIFRLTSFHKPLFTRTLDSVMLALAAAIHLNIGGLVPRNGSVLVLVTRYSTLLLSISDAHVVHLGQMSQNNHKHPSLWTREGTKPQIDGATTFTTIQLTKSFILVLLPFS
jgi:hypothetical protein